MGAGRPVEWTEEKIKEVCKDIFTQIAEKGVSLRSILDNADRNQYPANITFLEWMSKYPELSKQYIHAKELRADKLFEEIFEIADNTFNDFVENEDGKMITNHEAINRSRLRVDARKWALSKMLPRVYGDKTDITTNGKDITTPVNQMTDEQIIKEIERLKTKGLI